MIGAGVSASDSSFLLLASLVLAAELLFVQPAWDRYWMAYWLMGIALAERVHAAHATPRALRYLARVQLLAIGIGYYVYQRLTQ
jgi:hypothetical protein